MNRKFISAPVLPSSRFYLALVVTFLFTGIQILHAAPSGAERDYVKPGESRGGLVYTPSSVEASHSGSSKQSVVTYTAFDGTSYQLLSHNGRHIQLLLPATAGEEPFTDDLIEELLDRLDILYSDYRDLMQAEPSGSGYLTVAFVAETCGEACGWLGVKGIELRDSSDNFANIISDLETGTLHNYFTHEMAHNFDLYSNYLSYLPDHAHAWTEIFEYFAPYRYAHNNHHEQISEDLYQSAASSIWQTYLESPKASWTNCVRDQLCEADGFPGNKLWAMIYYRIEALHGIEAIEDSFAFLKNYAKSKSPPVTLQEKEDLRLMSLAVGANTNISCYLDDLKWVVSPKLKSDMQARFGNANTLCGDRDKDGHSLVMGDCDDHDAARNPSHEELPGNGIDEDCDGILDEMVLKDSGDHDLPGYSSSLPENTLPLEILGSMSSLEDRDGIKFALPPSGRVRARLCGKAGFTGWASALQPGGQFLASEFWTQFLDSGGCRIGTFDFGSLDSGGIVVQACRTVGEYSLTLSAADEGPPDYSPLLSQTPHNSGGVNLEFSDPEGQLSSLGADEIEIWISGASISLAAPYAENTAIVLNSASAAQLISGNEYQARLRPLANGVPLASYSAGHLFAYHAGSYAPPQLHSGFSGAWYDPTHDGEGFIVEILDGGQALVYWFTYTRDAKQSWMLGVGEVQGNQIVIKDLMRTEGGRFGDNFDPNDVILTSVGSMSITFQDCNSANVNYSVDRVGDHQSLRRLTEVHGHRCDRASEKLNSDISGSWFDPEHNGEGFIVEQLSADQAMVFWFTYTDTGEQAWMLNTGSITNGLIRIDNLLQPKGGHFGRSFKPAEVSRQPWGSLELQLDCAGGDASYSTDLADFANGSQRLIPLTRLKDSACAR